MKLTVKERKFAELVVELGNQSEAYRRAYDLTDEGADWIASKASHLVNKDNIRTTIETLRKELAEKHEVTKDLIAQKYIEIINDSEHTFNLAKLKDADKEEKARFYRMAQVTNNADKLRALDALNKMYGFNEPEETKVTVTFKTNWGT